MSCFLFFTLAFFVLKQWWPLEASGSWGGGGKRVQVTIEVLILPLSSFAALGKLLHLSVLQFSHLYLLNGVVVRIDGGICKGLRNSETGI